MSGEFSFTENAQVVGAAGADVLNPVNWLDYGISKVTGGAVSLPGTSTYAADVSAQQYDAHNMATEANNARTYHDDGAGALATTGAGVEAGAGELAQDVGDAANKVAKATSSTWFWLGVGGVAVAVIFGPAIVAAFVRG